MSVEGGPDIVTDGLVLHLDAANNRSFVSGGTTWFDLSGNRNTGSLVNGPTYNSANNGSISFDGTNDYVNCGKPTSLNFGTGSFTITAWIKPSIGNVIRIIGAKGTNAGDSGWWFAVENRYNSNTEAISFSANSLSANGNYVSKGTTSAFKYRINEWNYVVGMWDSSLKDIYIYINTVLATTTVVQSGGTGASGVTNTDNANKDTVFMSYSTSADLPISGLVSSVMAYNKLLSAKEIRQNYNATKGRYDLF